MKTPVCDFVSEYIKSNNIRMHMPGHKGVDFIGFEKYDITEIDGADILYASAGIIRESETNASELFGTGRTVYSTQGSSLVIQAMTYLTLQYSRMINKAPLIAAGRNAHKTFITACALVNIDISWIYGEDNESMISCNISPEYLDTYLTQCPISPVAVYITSPDYLGNIADVKGLSQVCRKHGVLLITDNAHGAYLKFLPDNTHPVSLGADMCCDSAHKTLPVLTGGAYLHISRNAPEFFADNAENAMSVFASTSPSYLILQSLDMANSYISDNYRQKLNDACRKIADLKSELKNFGFNLSGTEPLKITIAPKSYGYTGYEIRDILNRNGIICEFADPDYIVLMLTPETSCSDIDKLKNVMKHIKRKDEIHGAPPAVPRPETVISPHEAILLPCHEIDTEKCIGKISAAPSVNCPPAIPIAVCGERLDENSLKCFKYYGITSCKVLDLK